MRGKSRFRRGVIRHFSLTVGPACEYLRFVYGLRSFFRLLSAAVDGLSFRYLTQEDSRARAHKHTHTHSFTCGRQCFVSSKLTKTLARDLVFLVSTECNAVDTDVSEGLKTSTTLRLRRGCRMFTFCFTSRTFFLFLIQPVWLTADMSESFTCSTSAPSVVCGRCSLRI
jgi:hypothetical protein